MIRSISFILLCLHNGTEEIVIYEQSKFMESLSYWVLLC